MSKTNKKMPKRLKINSVKLAYFFGFIIAVTFGLLSILLVYSHYNYKESQKRQFIEKWDTIADRISFQASNAISSKGLINDEFASYLYWIPAISKDIAAIVLVDNQNKPIYLTGTEYSSDSLLTQYAERALAGVKQIILPEESKTGHTIIAVPVLIRGTIEAALLITLNDSPEKYFIGSAYFEPVIFCCLVFILFLAILFFAFSQIRAKNDFSIKVLSAESFLATLGAEKEKLQEIIKSGLDEIVTVLDCKTGSVYLKDISGGIRFYGSYPVVEKKQRKNFLCEFEPGDPRLQTITRGEVSIYEDNTKAPVSFKAAKKSECEICIAIPLSVQSDIIGVLTLTFAKKAVLSTDLLFIYQQIVNKFAYSIHNSLEFEDIIGRAGSLQFALDITEAMGSSKSAQTALGKVSAKIASAPGVSFCRIFILENKGKRLSLAAETFSGEGLNAELDSIHVYLDEMPIHKIALMSGQTQILKPGEIEKLALIKNNLYNSKMENCTIQITPLQYKNSPLGCLTVGIFDALGDAEDKKELLENIAHHISLSLKNLIQNSNIKKSFEHLKASHERELRLAKLQALGDLSEGFSKSLDTVVEPLLKNIAKLQCATKDKNKSLEILDAINSNIILYKSMLERFHQFSSIKTTGQLHQLELAQIAKTAERRLKEDSSKWAIGFDRIRLVTLNAGSGQIFGNDEELYQAISIIILNAIEAMPEGGDITIETKIEGKMAILGISDQGSGMTDDEIKHAFEPFFTTKEGFCRGLGLSIAHRIVALHNGEIEIESVLGRGSKFSIRIPLVDPEQTALYSVKKKSTRSMPLSN